MLVGSWRLAYYKLSIYIISVITCLCRPVMLKYDTLPMWAQCLVSFVCVGIPMIVAAFFLAQALTKFYYGG